MSFATKRRPKRKVSRSDETRRCVDSSELMRTRSETTRAGGVLLAGSLLSKAIRLFGDLFLGRILGAAGFGVISAAMSLVGILGELALLGAHRATLRFASLGGGERIEGLTCRAMLIPLIVGGALLAIVVLVREPLTYALFGASVSPWILPTFSLAIPAIGVFSVSQFTARARKKFAFDTLIGDVARMGLPVVGTLGFFAFDQSLWSATWGFVTGSIATAIVGLVAVHRRTKSATAETAFSKGVDLSRAPAASATDRQFSGAPATTSAPPPLRPLPKLPSLREFLRVALPLSLGSASILLLNELDKVMLAAFRPEEEVGVYNAAFRIARQILIVMPALNAAISPYVAPLLAEGRTGELRQLYRRTVQWSLAAGWSATLLFCIFARDFLGLFGDDFEAGTAVLWVVCLGHLANAAAGTVAVVIQYSGNEKKELMNGALVMAASLGLNILLIPPFGALGAALSSCIALTFVNALRMQQAWRILDVMPYDRGTLGVLAAGLAGAALGWGGKLAVAQWTGAVSPVLGVTLGTVGMALGWAFYFGVVGVTENEAQLLRLPRGVIKIRANALPSPPGTDQESAFVPRSHSPGHGTSEPHLHRFASKGELPRRPKSPESPPAPR